jgi:2-keto-3-deoxy-L-rhamnonate aldolase RhmA
MNKGENNLAGETKIPGKRHDVGIWRFKENPVKRKIKRGELTLGLEQRWGVHGMEMNYVQFISQAGFDFAVIDTEHTPYYGLESCQGFVTACEAFGIVPFVRISGPFEPILVSKALDMGFYGVWVPHVVTKKDCETVVAAAKFKLPGWEYGKRGVSHGFHADGYGTVRDRQAWQRFCNEETMVTILPLEELEAIKNIEEIISVPGLDMISLSAGDLPQCLGYPDQPAHPEVMKVRDRVADLCLKKGIHAYCIGRPELYFKHYWDKGVRCFYAADALFAADLFGVYKNFVEKVQQICK